MVKYIYGYGSGAMHDNIVLTGSASPSAPAPAGGAACSMGGTHPPAAVSTGNNVIGCYIQYQDSSTASEYRQITVPAKTYAQPSDMVAAVNKAFACAGVPLCMTHRCRPGTLVTATQTCTADESSCNATCTDTETSPPPATDTDDPPLVSLSPMFALTGSCGIQSITIGGSSSYHTMRSPLGMGIYVAPTAPPTPNPTATSEQEAIRSAQQDRGALVITSAKKYAVAPFMIQQNAQGVCSRYNNSRIKALEAQVATTSLTDVSATQCQLFSSQVSDKDPDAPYKVGNFIKLYYSNPVNPNTSPPYSYNPNAYLTPSLAGSAVFALLGGMGVGLLITLYGVMASPDSDEASDRIRQRLDEEARGDGED